MRGYKYQYGLGTIAWICVLVVVVFFGMCAFKLVPVYNDNLFVRTALKNLSKSVDGVQGMSDGEIRKELNSFYEMNNVNGEATKNLVVDRHRDRTLVKIDYEVRVPLFANISVVMSFNNVLDSSRPEACCSAL